MKGLNMKNIILFVILFLASLALVADENLKEKQKTLNEAIVWLEEHNFLSLLEKNYIQMLIAPRKYNENKCVFTCRITEVKIDTWAFLDPLIEERSSYRDKFDSVMASIKLRASLQDHQEGLALLDEKIVTWFQWQLIHNRVPIDSVKAPSFCIADLKIDPNTIGLQANTLGNFVVNSKILADLKKILADEQVNIGLKSALAETVSRAIQHSFALSRHYIPRRVKNAASISVESFEITQLEEILDNFLKCYLKYTLTIQKSASFNSWGDARYLDVLFSFKDNTLKEQITRVEKAAEISSFLKENQEEVLVILNYTITNFFQKAPALNKEMPSKQLTVFYEEYADNLWSYLPETHND